MGPLQLLLPPNMYVSDSSGVYLVNAVRRECVGVRSARSGGSEKSENR
jgi:hypothetical protein